MAVIPSQETVSTVEGKVCSKCGEYKTLDCFYVYPYNDGRRPDCKACKNAQDWNRVKSDPEKRKKSNEQGCAYYQANKARIEVDRKTKREANLEAHNAYQREGYRRRGGIPEHTRVKQRISSRKRMAERRKTDTSYIFACSIRTRIASGLNGKRKADRTEKLLGCSFQDLRTYIEARFRPGMTWENRGAAKRNGPLTWQLDHIIPCASFDFTDPEQQKQCFHWTNLQPL